jgi:hypothetical protein
VGAGAVPLITDQGLYRAEHRALRELHATSRQLGVHWRRLVDRLDGEVATPLNEGSLAARDLTRELGEQTGRHGLHGFPAAQGVGERVAGLRNTLGDLLLERNQALRIAVLDAEHVVILLEYLEAMAAKREDEELAGFHRRWQQQLSGVVDVLRTHVVKLADDPEGAIQPAEDSALGRAGHGVANAMGTVGEAFDASPLGRAARKVTGR